MITARDAVAVASACTLAFAAVAYTTFRLCCWADTALNHHLGGMS